MANTVLRTDRVHVEIYWEPFREYCREGAMRYVRIKLSEALAKCRANAPFDPEFSEYSGSFTMTVMPYGGWINNDAPGAIYLERKRHIMLRALESIRS